MQCAPNKILSEDDAVRLTRRVVGLIRPALQHGSLRLLKGRIKKGYELRCCEAAGFDAHYSAWDFRMR